jgi:hypothetical protein
MPSILGIHCFGKRFAYYFRRIKWSSAAAPVLADSELLDNLPPYIARGLASRL